MAAVNGRRRKGKSFYRRTGGRRERPANRHTRLNRGLACHRQPNHGCSIVEIVITIGPFVLFWLLASFSLRFRIWRLFVACGSCGRLSCPLIHDPARLRLRSFFRHRLVNDWVGRVIGVLTLTPYNFWRRAHGVHHATSGNLDHRGMGDIDTLTVREYLSLRAS